MTDFKEGKDVVERLQAVPGSRRLKSAALILFPLVAAGALLAVCLGRRSDSPPPPSTEPSAAERAQAIREFRNAQGPNIDARIDERLKRDASFAGSLRTVDREYVRSLEDLSDAEKDELWQLVQAAKARLPREPADRGGH